ncbi:MAG: hypothetical protein AAF621_00525 [Pseudomonadota bacterium]
MVIKDGNWELIEYVPELKRSLWRYFDGERTHYRTTYETDDIIEANKQEQNLTAGQRWGEWRIVASIPAGLFFEHLGEAVKNRDERYVSKYLNDADNRDFRTFLGTV